MQEFLSSQDTYKEITNNINRDNSSSVEVEEMTMNNVLKFMIANDMCSTYPNLSTKVRIVKNELGGSATQQELKG